MCVTAIYMIISSAIIGHEQYQTISESGKTTHDPLLSSILFITLYSFFAYFWTKNGQTLGMQAWHLRIENPDHTAISLYQALVRFLTAAISLATCGLGYLWMLVDKKDRTWHCIASDSVIVRIPKK